MLRFVPLAAASSVLLLACSAKAQIRAEVYASGFSAPIGFIQNPADPTVQVVLEQAGRVRILKDGVTQANDFLDLRASIASGGEQGLLGFAFAPNYATSGRVFVSFTDRQGNSVIARFTRSSSDPLRADPNSRFDLVWPGGRRSIDQPFANHNGGHIAFGPDGFLYFGLGDGGSGDDPMNLAQNPASLLGKMLRLDVNVPASDPEGYDVPPSNPFVGRAGVLPEIWAIGMRNPWRWSFDNGRNGTNALVIGDVGQNAWEEIDYEPAGAGGRNYGWRNREGAHDNVTNAAPFSQPLSDPIFEYPRSDGRSITGGYVYRGTGLGAAYAGRYFFADFVTSRVWSIALGVNPTTREATASNRIDHSAELGVGAVSPASFGVDASGELYLVSYAGVIYRIAGPGVVTPPDPSGGTDDGRRRGTGPVTGTARPRNP